MEIVNSRKHLLCGDIPHEYIDKLRLAFSSHLASSYNLFLWVYGHSHYVFIMQIEEFLRVLALIEDDTEGGGREHDLILVDILQVAAGVEAAETVRILQL